MDGPKAVAMQLNTRSTAFSYMVYKTLTMRLPRICLLLVNPIIDVFFPLTPGPTRSAVSLPPLLDIMRNFVFSSSRVRFATDKQFNIIFFLFKIKLKPVFPNNYCEVDVQLPTDLEGNLNFR